MKQLLKTGTALTLALTFTSVVAQDAVPNRTVKLLDGSTTSLMSILQKSDFTVITFWATWCIPCKKELENIRDLYPEWVKDYKAQVVAVSIDDAKTMAGVKPYVIAQDFKYIFLLDTNKELFQALNGVAPPLTIVADKTGKILMVKNKYVEGDEWILDEKLSQLSKKG